jgi:uncharacterized glyoxalase superfamily protein PhnB
MNPNDGCGVFSVRPILCVDNVARSLDYYISKLGFHAGWVWADSEQRFLEPGDKAEPTFALVGLGQVQLMLSQRSQGSPGMWLHIDVHQASQVDSLNELWLRNGARIIEPPTVRPWGMYEMRVQDLDGHTLRISSPP